MGRDVPQALMSCSLLRELSEEDILAFASSFETREYEENADVVTQGSDGTAAFIVLVGRLGIRYRVALDEDEQLPFTPIIARPGTGELVGEFALLDGRPRSASIFAVEPVSLLVLERAEFEAFLHSHAEMGLTILSNLSRGLVERMRETDLKLAAAMEWGWKASGFDAI